MLQQDVATMVGMYTWTPERMAKMTSIRTATGLGLVEI